MTVPVSTQVTKVEKEDSQVTRLRKITRSSPASLREQMGFFIPEEYQEGPPQPQGEVNIVTRPEMTVFVRTFGGYAKDGDWEDQRNLLLSCLESHQDFGRLDKELYYRQGYDAPYKFWNRKNEVFLVKKED